MLAMQAVFPPYLIRKVVALRASILIWEEHTQNSHALWTDTEDMEFCSGIISKNPSELTERECLIVEMLALKYSDQPCEADLSKGRVLN